MLLRAHDRSGCVRRQIDTKEVTAKPSAWRFGNAVFKTLDLPARARCCRSQLVLLRYSLGKAHLLKYLFLFGFVKTGQTVRGVWYAGEQNELASCHLWMCFAVIVGLHGHQMVFK